MAVGTGGLRHVLVDGLGGGAMSEQKMREAFEVWWRAVLNDLYSEVGIDDKYIARLAWNAALAQHPAAVVELTDEFYLQESSSFVGNDMVFWRKNGDGYTTDLRDAHVYTLAEAHSRQKSRRTDIPWRKSYIDSKARPAVDFQYVSDDDAALFAAQIAKQGGAA